MGDLIGRRREARQLIRVLTGHKETLDSIGRKAGCQILGVGGVGKSSLAGRVMQRMAERGWPIVTVSGVWNLGSIATAFGSALWNHPQRELAELARQLNDPQAPDNLRLEWLKGILTQHDVLLVLDNFEDVLTPAGAGFRDAVTEQIFALMLHSAECGKLLITSRYPIRGADDYLHRVDLGPLSRAEVRKLMLRHEGLRRQSSESVKLIERAIGGHPRTLEYLDALLRNGKASMGRVQERLREYAARAGVSLEPAGGLEERVGDAIRVAAADALVEELVGVLGQTPGDLDVLWQASVFPFPVPVEALTFSAGSPDPPVDAAQLSAVVDRLVASSLLAILEDRHVIVHRWTAESLKSYLSKEAYQGCCARAAKYLEKRRVADRRQWVTDLTESTRLFLAAQEFDRAAGLAWQLIRFLRPYGQTTVWTELAREVSAALPAGHDDKLRFLLAEGDGLRSLGFTARALERYRLALEIAERLVEQEPERADYLRDLSVSCNKMGDLQRALGQGETARQFYEKDLEIAERLVEQEPGRADYLRDLSVSYNKMGDLQRALGQGETARQFYEKALEIAERLVEQEPGRADYLRDLWVSYNKMGDLQRALGQGETARQFYEKALEIAERLVEQEPGRADYLRDLWVSYNKMGDLQSALGQGETARQFYEKALEIAERLVEQEPGRADYLRDLSVSYNKMGDLQRALGQGETARQLYEKALEIAELLVEQEPGRADYLRDLSVSYNKMGDLQRALGQGETARQFYEKSLELRERLVEQEPERADYLRDLSVSYERMGDLQRALGQGETARQFYEKALELRERLVEQEPGRADYLRDLSVSYDKIGDLQSALGQGETARQFHEKALEIAERLVEQEPGRADYLRDLSVSYNKMGDLQRALGQGETARQFYEKDLEIAERLVEQEPGRADYRIDLAKSLARLEDSTSLRRASEILAKMQESSQLMPEDVPLVDFVERMLQQAQIAGA